MKTTLFSMICLYLMHCGNLSANHNDEFKDQKIDKIEILSILEEKSVEITLRIKEMEVEKKFDRPYFYLYGKYQGLDEAIFQIKCLGD